MNPEIKAAIAKEAEEHGEMVMKNNHVMWEGSIPNAFTAGAEYGYRLGYLMGKLDSDCEDEIKEMRKKELQELLG